MPRMLITTVLALLLAASGAAAALVPSVHPLFDGDTVHEVRLTFEQSNYWSLLTSNYQNYDDIPYIEASLEIGDDHLASIGVRFKGNSSYSYPGNKKSFKLDLDEYVADQELYGLDKLNLNNCFLDPSFVREKVAYEFCDALGMATGRTNFAAVYINGSYWGLYLLVEQQDKEFLESRHGAGEDGNLWKGEPYGTHEYLGSSESAYYDDYELKTNETANDWSALVDYLDILNNTSISVLPDSLHERVDVESALAMLAVDNYTVNLDSYVGRCANNYFYHRDRDSRFVYTKWDQNESFGIFNQYGLSTTQMQQLSPLWTNTQWGEDRPLAERLFQIDAFVDVYYGHMQKLMAGPAEPATLIARMEQLRDLVRPYVETDPNFMYTTSQFESCMDSNVSAGGGPGPGGGRTIPALATFVTARYNYLAGLIGTWTPIEGLVLNEVMAKNDGTLADEHGDYDDWIEVTNTSGAAIDLTGLGLTDHMEGSPDFVFPSMVLAPGASVVVWADEEPEQGDLHAPFKLDADGEDVYLTDGGVIVDRVTFPALPADVSWGRWPHGDGAWQQLSAATPGSDNLNPSEPETVVLYINEFLALNNSGIQDEAGSFEDWVEIYNPGPEDVAMGGLFLTDDLANTTQWAFPDTTLAAGGFLVVWCDNDEEDGPLHANFKLSGGGEEIGLFGRLAAGNLVVDSREFGDQTADVSEGRVTDGAGSWTTFAAPTPGSANDPQTGAPVVAAPVLRLLPNYPNPFNPMTTLAFELPATGRALLEVYDAQGRRVAKLVDELLDPGQHTVVWTGRDENGGEVASGVYFSRLISDGQCKSGRLTLIR